MKKLLAALLFAASNESAQVTGNTLLDNIESSEHMLKMHALGYITGIFQLMRGTAHCSPDGVTFRQARDVVHNYLKTDPKYRHLDGYVIVIAVFGATWPCKGQI
ncbi:MAG: hypothetical protein ING25_11390 [Burkholderiales bacterium]|nr:hypothetical protein [Burkholderiales bacterium]